MANKVERVCSCCIQHEIFTAIFTAIARRTTCRFQHREIPVTRKPTRRYKTTVPFAAHFAVIDMVDNPHVQVEFHSILEGAETVKDIEGHEIGASQEIFQWVHKLWDVQDQNNLIEVRTPGVITLDAKHAIASFPGEEKGLWNALVRFDLRLYCPPLVLHT
jgi:hypothetical protein